MRKRHLSGAALICALGLAAQPTLASSHREAPAIAGMPRVDATDFYMFRSYEPGRSDFVTIIANYVPLQSPYGGPNYFRLDNDAIYEIHIDNTGDAVEDLTFQFNFNTILANKGDGIELPIGTESVGIPLRQAGAITDPRAATINEREIFRLDLIRGDRRTGRKTALRHSSGSDDARTFLKPLDNIGTKTFPDYEAYAQQHSYSVQMPGCATPAKVFVGQRAEGFAVNLGEIFDLVNLVPIQGADSRQYPQYNVPAASQFPGGIRQARANDDVVGEFNVTSLALELPIACITGKGNGVIGGWTTASLPKTLTRNETPGYNDTAAHSGDFVQVSRLSAPLVNEVVIGLKDKDLFNAAEPTQDGALATYVTNPTLPALVNLLFRDAVNTTLGANIANLAPANLPRNDLVTAFLTGFPGLNQQGTVTPSEMMRLNTAIPPTPRARQHSFGVVAEDLAGFPNGRRPADDTVDIALRVMMGALCHPLPLATELGVSGAKEDTPSDLVNLGLCKPEDAPIGPVALTDGAPLRATDFQNRFPYLNAPIPGSPNN